MSTTSQVYLGSELRWQKEQYKHDQRNHADIQHLSKVDRLKHYGLHYAKYVGRMLRRGESKSLATTSIDSLLVSLSAANTLHQRLSVDISLNPNQNDFLEQYASTMSDVSTRWTDLSI